jgi:multidrug resistance efflux pump
MKTENDVQVEDSQTLESSQSEETKTEPKPEPKIKHLSQIILPWVIVSAVFFFFGAGLVYFTLYQTATTDLAAAKTQVSDLSTKLSGNEVDLEKAKNDLNTAQIALTSAQSDLGTEKISSILYKLQTDVNNARVALLKLDPSSARQALTFATSDLNTLSQTSIDADKLSGLQERINTALISLESDPQKANDSLDTLYTNLLLISDNLK